MYPVRPNMLIRKLYPSAIWRILSEEKKLFLTFDDGPTAEVTPQILSILHSYSLCVFSFSLGSTFYTVHHIVITPLVFLLSKLFTKTSISLQG